MFPRWRNDVSYILYHTFLIMSIVFFVVLAKKLQDTRGSVITCSLKNVILGNTAQALCGVAFISGNRKFGKSNRIKARKLCALFGEKVHKRLDSAVGFVTFLTDHHIDDTDIRQTAFHLFKSSVALKRLP